MSYVIDIMDFKIGDKVVSRLFDKQFIITAIIGNSKKYLDDIVIFF